MSFRSDNNASTSGAGAHRATSSEAIFDKVDWSRPALLFGDRKGNEPLGASPWDVWRWLAPVVFVGFTLIAVIWSVNHVEDTLEENAADVLLEAGITIANLSFDANYRSLEVTGQLPDGSTAAEIEQTLLAASSNEFDLRNATVIAHSPAVQGPVSLAVAVASDGQTITLTGTVATQDHKDLLLSTATETGLLVEDLITVAGVESVATDPDGQISDLVSIIDLLDVGTFTAATLGVGDVGAVMGEIVATNSETAAILESAISDGVTVSAPDVLGSLDVDANYDGTRIILDGTVLSAEQANQLEDVAAEVVGDDNVVNNLMISNLDPAVDGADERVRALARSVSAFDELVSADATLDDSDLTVNGFAFDEDGQTGIDTALDTAQNAGLRPGGVISIIRPEDLPVQDQIDLLQARLDALEEEIRDNVVFESNDSALSPEATATLDRVAEAMNEYPLPVVEVGGHTDDLGPEDLNEALSQARADAVATYLAQSIDAARLAAVGFGESQPISDSTSDQARAENRRVELIARESF